MNLVYFYTTDTLFRVVAKPIMSSRSRLNYKRDMLRSALHEIGIDVKFEMKDLRELHYYLNPADNKRKVWLNIPGHPGFKVKSD